MKCRLLIGCGLPPVTNEAGAGTFLPSLMGEEEERESFQDGGADLPVRWKTIETPQWGRVSSSAQTEPFPALTPLTSRPGPGPKGATVRAGSPTETRLKYAASRRCFGLSRLARSPAG